MAKGQEPTPRTKAAVRSRRTPAPQPGSPPASGTLAVVGIGASAGGLDAISRLLSALPADTGMAFVIVSHLSPNHQSMMAEILSRKTAIPVLEVKDEPAVQPNHAYVIPPARTMMIEGGKLRLFPRTEPDGHHHPVDVFFTSLAQDQRERSIGVILSGTANDGTLGLEEIKAHGGLTFAQDASAEYAGMPENAVAGGGVDLVLPPEGIAAELQRIARHPHFEARTATRLAPADASGMTLILGLLQEKFGGDLGGYKRTTLYRRITRRMVLHKLNDIRQYAALLRNRPDELELLYRDILINVTSFFRNPEAYDALKAEVFPKLIANRSRNEPLRIWSLGCSTGEEAYSIAIALTEFLEHEHRIVPVQIFATDVNDVGVTKARTGMYSRGIAHDLSPERLHRFFTDVGTGYQVNKAIRQLCVFAKHNGLVDPPFSRIDLVSCRNVLIYLEAPLQQRLIPILHYALAPHGYLWLGSSETVGSSRDLFDTVDPRQKIYRCKAVAPRPRLGSPVRTRAGTDRHAGRPALDAAALQVDTNREAERLLVGRYAPPGVLVSADFDILQFRGDTGQFVTPTPGKASFNLLKMLREGLLVPVRGALARARKQHGPAREDGVQFRAPGGMREVSIEVIPVRGAGSSDQCFLVVFELPPAPLVPTPRRRAASTRADDRRESRRLNQELAATKDYLQSVIEQQDAANEDLQLANEEIQSTNEELQSINEELETSKEEIQSTNEELSTVNEELHNRNLELATTNNDLVNLLASVELAIVMLGADLRIRRFTPAAEQLLNLIPGDVGRPIGHIKLNVELPDFESLVRQVIAAATPEQREVRDDAGHWFSVRVRPYRAPDNRVDGAVVVLVDIDSIKRAADTLHESEARFRLLADSAPVLIWVDDADGDRFANRAYLDFVGTSASGVRAGRWHEFIHPDDRARYLAIYADAAARNVGFETQVRFHRADGQYRWMKAIATPRNAQAFAGFVGSKTDITDLKDAELALVNADRSKDEFLAILSHELRNPLAPLQNVVQLLRADDRDPETTNWALDTLDRQIHTLTLLVNDLLDISRISHGKINLRREPTDLVAVLRAAATPAERSAAEAGQSLVVRLPDHPVQVMADALRLEQVFGNLLNNATKFTPEGGHIWLSVSELPESAGIEVSVRDDGAGISAELLPTIFELFRQGDRSTERLQGGLGVGLTVVRRLVQLHGGSVEARSDGPGRGSEFVVRLPVIPGGQASVPAG